MIDNYGRKIDYLRLSVTEQCNLRCRYCMPEEVEQGNKEELLTKEEMVMAVKVASSLGISKVRITGGEPLVRNDIVSLCEQIASIEEIKEVCLTTNGVLLSELAVPLVKAGVNRINISLDTLHPKKYEYMTKRNRQEQALQGLKSALLAGFEQVKVNVVLIRGFNEDEIVDLANLTKKYPIDVRFIEWMPMYENKELKNESFLPCESVLFYLPEAIPIKQQTGVAKLYRLPNAKGNIGLISPISNHFCASCNRLRLTADGKLKPCLHSSQEFSIKGKDDIGMLQQFQKAILEKPERHQLSTSVRSSAGRNMNQIGG